MSEQSSSALESFFFNPNLPRRWGFLLLSLPTGIFYFVSVVVLLALGVALTPIVVGIPVLVLLFALVHKVAQVESSIAANWLGVGLASHDHPSQTGGLWARFKTMGGSSLTWRTILYMLIKLPFGILAFVFSVVFPVLSTAFLVSGSVYLWLPENWSNLLEIRLGEPVLVLGPEVGFVVLTVLGLAFGALSLLIINGFAVAWGQFSKAMLSSHLEPPQQALKI